MARTDRHASPVHYHFSRSADGTYRVRVTAFPAAGLPSFTKSKEFLQQFLQRFAQALQGLIQAEPRDPAHFRVPSTAPRAEARCSACPRRSAQAAGSRAGRAAGREDPQRRLEGQASTNRPVGTDSKLGCGAQRQAAGGCGDLDRRHRAGAGNCLPVPIGDLTLIHGDLPLRRFPPCQPYLSLIREGLAPYYQVDGSIVSIPNVVGEGYRLPTEHEWEYACRAGTSTKWCCNEPDLPRHAWFGKDSDAPDTYKPMWVNDGDFRGNRWGLFHMHGNVLEWCWDEYREDYSRRRLSINRQTDGTADRTLRGGAFCDKAEDIRSASRFRDNPTAGAEIYGFRVARNA